MAQRQPVTRLEIRQRQSKFTTVRNVTPWRRSRDRFI